MMRLDLDEKLKKQDLLFLNSLEEARERDRLRRRARESELNSDL